MDLLDYIADSATTGCRLRFLDLDDHAVPVAELWDESERAARWLLSRTGGGAVAMLLDTSPECIASFIGAMRAGLRIVSLPLPPRGGDLAWYADYLLRTCAAADVTLVVVDGTYLDLVPVGLGFGVASYHQAVSGRAAPCELDVHTGELVQFTSGSTADPKGVVLSLDKIAANIEAILAVLSPDVDDVSVSWLPLSHDMGLIGMLLSSLVASSSKWVNGGEIVLIKPESFIRQPALWLRACSDFGATITAAPDFALHLAMLAGERSRTFELSKLRACITGAEPVKATTLRSFERKFNGAGFRSKAFCPAYGLAEAALAVSMVPPEKDWTTAVLDREKLHEGEIMVTPAGAEFASAGQPLPGYEVSILGSGAVGLVTVEGPSVSDRYLGEARRARAFHTNDIGFFHDDELYLVGRSDEVVLIAGRKLALADVDAAIEATGLAQPGRAAAAYEPEIGLVVAVEPASTSTAPKKTAQEISTEVSNRTGHRPRSVVLVERSTLPRTTSGKPRRAEIAARVRDDTLATIHRLDH